MPPLDITDEVDQNPLGASTPEDKGQPAISLRNISKKRGREQTLADISLEVGRGEMLVVLGPSGGGKTTLLRIVAGLEEPDSGEVYLNGVAANLLTPRERQLGVVFQEQALFSRMTAEENISYGLRVRKVDRARTRRRVDELLELTSLQDHRRKYPSQLSGGQRQRVAVARALAHQPTAILFDEPFSALDAVARTELRRDIRSLLRELKVTALFITHDQEEALELADRVAVLNKGVIEQEGTPFEIYNHPRSEFVATFLGAANVLHGTWRSGRVVLGSTEMKVPYQEPGFAEHQPVRIVFRPEDAVLNFQPQLLGTPFYLGRGIVEDVYYVGPIERLRIRLTLWQPPDDKQPNKPLALVDETYATGFPINVSRSKWKTSEMELSIGDLVVVGLKDYRLLPYYPIGV
ncbi:MAG: sulfate/thiosulfate transport system ATP-binding protein [Blastocatellia bacterium]|jgi:ABC-type Fe3+/spermidine/putrescine transport system ATPase subunit|nr:sulfate/thiosulfate transport system ATP-binding protein [Blastocatellia bacterium]